MNGPVDSGERWKAAGRWRASGSRLRSGALARGEAGHDVVVGLRRLQGEGGQRLVQRRLRDGRIEAREEVAADLVSGDLVALTGQVLLGHLDQVLEVGRVLHERV